MMVAHYGIPAPPPALGRSKVSRKLQLSPQEKVKLRLAVFTFFGTCFTSLFLLLNVVSPEGFPTFRDEYYSRGVIPDFDKTSITAGPLSSSWAYYSPYRPAGKFEGLTPEGCVVSQVNIVSFFSLSRSISQYTHLLSLPAASTSWSPIPNFRSGQGNRKGARQASSRHQL